MILTYPHPSFVQSTRIYSNGASYSSVFEDTTRNDSRLDERRSLVRTPKGAWRPPTPYWRNVDTGRVYTFDANGTIGYFLSDNSEQIYDKTGSMNQSGYYYDVPLSVPGQLENNAIIKARLKLKDQDINLAQAFGERKQTANLVGNSLSSIIGTLRALKKGDLHAAQKALGLRRKGRNSRLRPEAAFDRWLELQYGWKPLLSDVEGASKRLWGIEREAGRMTARCKAVSSDNVRTERVFTDSIGNVYVRFTKHRDIKFKTFVRFDFIRSDNTGTANWSELGIVNPLSLAWELLPFSFVFDWFVPVGDYLSSLDATVGWEFKGGSCTTVMEEKGRVNFKDIPPIAYTYGQYGSVVATGKYRRYRMNRKIYDSCPIPTRPAVDTGASFLHVANGIALLGSIFSGGIAGTGTLK